MNDMINNDHSHPINSDKPTLIFCKEREKLFSVFLQHFLFRDKSANIINSLLDKIELKDIYMRKDKPGLQMRGDRVGFENMREQNAKLAAKLERLIKRERDLRITLNQLARDNNNGNY
jgi:hypothetical protein